MYNDEPLSMIHTAVLLHILQNRLLVLGGISGLLIRFNIRSLVSISESSHLAERIKDVCRNEQRTSWWHKLSITIGQRLSHKLHCEVYVSLPLGRVFSYNFDNTIHIIKLLIVHSHNVMQCNCIPDWYPPGPLLEWHQTFHHVFGNGTFIPRCEMWAGIRVVWSLEQLPGDFL
jgi:hypothetical protein